MLPRKNRLTTKDITRLFNRVSTQKIPAYPFVYFVGPVSRKKMLQTTVNMTQDTTQWGIQLPNKMIKSAVKRHTYKRLFYACIQEMQIDLGSVCILAVPQKKRAEEISQILATDAKRDILAEQKKAFTHSLSTLIKKYGDKGLV